MRLYTAEEISDLLARLGNFNTQGKSEKVMMDYMAVIQSIAGLIDEFLAEHEKPRRAMFLGLFGTGDDEE